MEPSSYYVNKVTYNPDQRVNFKWKVSDDSTVSVSFKKIEEIENFLNRDRVYITKLANYKVGVKHLKIKGTPSINDIAEIKGFFLTTLEKISFVNTALRESYFTLLTREAERENQTMTKKTVIKENLVERK